MRAGYWDSRYRSQMGAAAMAASAQEPEEPAEFEFEWLLEYRDIRKLLLFLLGR
jgi:hypothetical protein